MATSSPIPDECAVGIEMAQKDKVDWLLHVDTDEMIYPSGSLAFSLQVRCMHACMPCGNIGPVGGQM